MHRYESIVNHLLQMNGEGGLGLPDYLGKVRQGLVGVLKFPEDLSANIVRYLYKTSTGVVELKINKRSVCQFYR